jgi:hypothetical protein
MSGVSFRKYKALPYDHELWKEIRKKMKEENEIFLGGLDIVGIKEFPKWFQGYAKGLKKLHDKFLNR